MRKKLISSRGKSDLENKAGVRFAETDTRDELRHGSGVYGIAKQKNKTGNRRKTKRAFRQQQEGCKTQQTLVRICKTEHSKLFHVYKTETQLCLHVSISGSNKQEDFKIQIEKK